jgi:Tfp pilus assembly protein PilF
MMFALILLLTFMVQPLASQNFFSIMGTVRDDSGHTVSSIRVSLEDENSQPVKTVFVDSSGRFQFRSLRPGNYRLRVETQGTPFEEQSIAIELQSMTRGDINPSITEEPTYIDVRLKRKKSLSTTAAGVVFAQVIPSAAREEYNRGAGNIKSDPDAAIASLQKAIEIFPDYFDALDLLGTEYVRRELFANAIPLLSHAAEINNRAYGSMYGLGFALLRLKRFAEAVEWLEKAAAGDSSNPSVYLTLGLAYGNNGALSESERALRKSYQLGGAILADAHLYLAGLYNKQERFGEAWRELELYLKEAKGLKDKTQINTMIINLKAKEKAKH